MTGETLTNAIVLAQELYRPNESLLWAVALGEAVWYLMLVGVFVLRWPRPVKAGAQVTDLGAESPAVVDLLTNGFQVSREAIPATMLDLAARGVLSIEDVGIGRYMCRLLKRDVPLTAYEERLLEHLGELARDGIVPAEAMTTGTRDEALKWWRGFRKDVVGEAQECGLCVDLFTKGAATGFFAVGVILVLIFEIAIGFNDTDAVERSLLLDLVTIVGFGMVFALIGAMAVPWQRDTDLGRYVASRWLGVRKSLATTTTFPQLPPSAVVVWERHLGYGAALGLAERAVESLPFGTEPDKKAWTHHGGGWRQITVRYPRLRPGYGRHPVLTLVLGVVWCGFAAMLLRALLPLAPMGDGGFLSETAVRVFELLRLVLVVLLGAALVWWAIAMAFAIPDVVAKQELVGEVLRTRTKASLPRPWVRQQKANTANFVAVFTGEGDTVDAFRVNQTTYGRFNQRQIVRVVYTPLVKYVREVTVITDQEIAEMGVPQR
jgi:hypothetical protein